MNQTQSQIPLRWMLVCLMGTVLLMALAYVELSRVEAGNLFLFSFSGEAPPTRYELIDARSSARTCLIPALLFLGMLGAVFCFVAPRFWNRENPTPTGWRPLLILFLIAVLADMMTTVWFFHSLGVDHELHPAIRLFGYAYGRTIGPLAGKLIQAICLLGLARTIGRHGPILLGLVATVYLIAAGYNLSQL